jgi:hypothetical protein
MNFPAFQYVLYLATVISIIRIRDMRKHGLLYINIFLIWNTIIETIGFYLENNIWLYNVSTIIEFTILTLFFYTRSELLPIRKQIIGMCAFYLIFSLFNITLLQGINSFDNYTFLLSSLFIVIVACYYFYQMLIVLDDTKIYIRPVFWILTGLIAFYTCCFPIFSFYNILLADYPEDLATLHKVIMTFNMVEYCSFIIGILWISQK